MSVEAQEAPTRGRRKRRRSPNRPTPSIAIAFLRMDIIEDISYPMSLVLSELGTVLPVLVSFFIGELVGDSVDVGGDYFTFAVLGLAVTAVLQGALGGFGGSLQRALNRGSLETLLVEPVPWTYLPFAMNLWRIMMGLLQGTLIMLIGLFLGADYLPSGWWQFLVLLVLGILACTAIGIVSAAILILSKRSKPFLTLYGMAASLLAGSVFSVSQLPDWLQTLSWAIPHTYVINASRAVLMEDPGSFVVPFDTAVLALLIFNVVVMSIGLWLFSRSLEYGRKMGMLSGY
ncbi:MAG: ABC transporter permease [Acidimicrobiia bacterium]